MKNKIVAFFYTSLTKEDLVLGKTLDLRPGFRLASPQKVIVLTRYVKDGAKLIFQAGHNGEIWDASLDETTGNLTLVQKAISITENAMTYYDAAAAHNHDGADENYLWGV